MDQWTLNLLTLGGLIALVVVASMYAARQRAAAIAAWQQFSQETGISISGSYPMTSFHGPWRGANISLAHTVFHGHKGQRHYRHEVAVQIPIDCGDLMIDREGFFDMIGKALGGQDIQVGDSRFDPAFRVRSSDEQLARDVLTTEVRQALLVAMQQFSTLHVSANAVRVSHEGIAMPREVFGRLQALLPIALAFQPR